MLKPLFDDAGSLRRQLEASGKRIALLESCLDGYDCLNERMLELIKLKWDTLRTLEPAAIGAALDELDDQARFDCGV